MRPEDEMIPPAVVKAFEQIADDSLTWLRPGTNGLETVTWDQMTEDERLLALTILQQRNARKMS
jgi:hypothetical protein